MKSRDSMVKDKKTESLPGDLQAAASFKTLVDNIADLAYICDDQGKILYINRLFEEYTAEKAEEFLGNSFEALFDEENLAKAYDLYHRTLKGESPTGEIVFKNTGLLCEFKSLPLRDDPGTVRRVIGIARDITERKVMEGELKRHRDDLEALIEERTRELKAANEQLKIEVAERQQAETGLTESEERYRTLVETIPYGIQENDTAGIITFSNRAHAAILGYEVKELVGKAIWDLYETEEAREELKGYFKRLVAEEPMPRPYTGKNITRDGKTIEIQIDWNYKHDKAGRLTGFVSIITDITERVRAEQAVIAEKEWLYSILDLFPGIVYLQAPDYSIRFANRFFKDRYGEPGTRRCHEIIWDRKEPCEECPTFRVFDTGEPVEWISEHASDGRVYQVYDYPLTDTDGTKLVLEIGMDITEINRAQGEHLDQNRFLKTLIDTIPNPIFYKDVEGRYLGCNKAFSGVAGLSDEALYGKTVYDIAPRGLADKYNEMDALLLKHPGIQTYEFSVKFKDGTIHDVIFNKATYYRKGVLAGLVGVMVDITERKLAEKDRELMQDELLQAKKLEAVGRVAGFVAHDFSNLMTVVNGCSQFLLMELGEGSKLSEAASEIRKAGKSAMLLTRQLLSFSRKQPIVPTLLDLNFVLLDMKEVVSRLMTEGIRLSVHTQDSESLVMADRGQVEQVIMNLALNARDAMEDGGDLKLCLCNVNLGSKECQKVSSSRPGHFVCMCVEDTGMGMTRETIENIFDPFFTTKEPGKGSGLGLAIAFGIVNRHKGWINVESIIEKGTRFKVYLPAYEEVLEEEDR